jgi:hypothetical protein
VSCHQARTLSTAARRKTSRLDSETEVGAGRWKRKNFGGDFIRVSQYLSADHLRRLEDLNMLSSCCRSRRVVTGTVTVAVLVTALKFSTP